MRTVAARGVLVVVLAMVVGCGSHRTARSPSTNPVTTDAVGSTSQPDKWPGAGDTGVVGLVAAGPTCPVERAGRPCPPNPLPRVRVLAVGADRRAVAEAVTDADGRFGFELPTGTFMIRVIQSGVLPRCPELSVDVGSDPRPRTVEIDCDTGIR